MAGVQEVKRTLTKGEKGKYEWRKHEAWTEETDNYKHLTDQISKEFTIVHHGISVIDRIFAQ